MPPKNKKKEADNETLTRIAIVSADRCACLFHYKLFFEPSFVSVSKKCSEEQHLGCGG